MVTQNLDSSSLFICIGPPRCGLSVLANCFHIAGLNYHSHRNNPKTINSLFLQDLGLSPLFAGSMPDEWQQGTKYQNFIQRVEKFCTDLSKSSKPYVIADSLLCRTLPAWHKILENVGFTPKYILCIRHPWEVALSLAATQNLSIPAGHVVWFSFLHDALRNIGDHKYTLITFGQLLSDPMSTLNSLFSLPGLGTNEQQFSGIKTSYTGRPINIDMQLSHKLLEYVQPSLKHHHASDIFEGDKETFAPYAELYDQLRATNFLNKYDTRYSLNRVEDECFNISQHPPILAHHSSIIDCLLQYISQHGYKEDHITKQTKSYNSEDSTPQLSLTISFPSPQNGQVISKSLSLISGEWQKITMPVPHTEYLKNKTITIKPLNVRGCVRISALSLYNQVNNNKLWSAASDDELRQLEIKKSYLNSVHNNIIELIITSTDSEIHLPILEGLPDVPLLLEFWIKPENDQEKMLKQWNTQVPRIKNTLAKDLCLHIGLRKTATTFLQDKIFTTFLPGYLGKYRSVLGLSSLINKAILGEANKNNYNSSKLIHLFVDRIFDQTSNLKLIFQNIKTFMISEEKLSFRPEIESVIEVIEMEQYEPSSLLEYPIFRSLNLIESIWKKEFGGNIKILLTVRDQAELLASEYSQQSAFIKYANQDDFEVRVTRYLNSGDEYLNFYAWAQALVNTLEKRENILIFDINNLNDSMSIEKVMKFVYPDFVLSENIVNEKVRQSRIDTDRWKIRKFTHEDLMNLNPPLYKYRIAYKGKPRGSQICLTNDLKNMINAYYSEGNEMLQKKYSDIIIY